MIIKTQVSPFKSEGPVVTKIAQNPSHIRIQVVTEGRDYTANTVFKKEL